MKKYLLLAVAAFAIAAPSLSFGQNAPMSGKDGPPPSPPPGGIGGSGGMPTPGGATGAEDGARFQQRKAEILQRMAEHQKCVQAASNREQLMACMPRPPEGGGLRGGMNGGGEMGSMHRSGANGGPGGAPAEAPPPPE